MGPSEEGMKKGNSNHQLDGLPGRKTSLASDKYDPETLEIDHVAEKKLVRKLDLYIVPVVMLLYLLVRTSPCPKFHLRHTNLPGRSLSSTA